jgi:hypothetical protein
MSKQFQSVEVAVAGITSEGKILAVYNPLWRAFTLPMTRRQRWRDPDVEQDERIEDWRDAAARAAAEILGRTLAPPEMIPTRVLDMPDYEQSDRDGIWKRYHFQVFKVQLGEIVGLVDGSMSEWLTRAELRDEDRRPISPTARALAKELDALAVIGKNSIP